MVSCWAWSRRWGVVMRLVDVHARLLQMGTPVFRTTDAAACLKIENAHASKLLERLAMAGHLVHLARSVWGVSGQVDPLALPSLLTAPLPSYVSLQTALYYHGMISQMSAVIYAVSLARTRRFNTPLGVVSVHHVDPGFFGGFVPMGKSRIPMATPEKALIDLLYLGPARSGLFRSLPELELPTSFKTGRARDMIRQIRSDRRRAGVAKRFESLMALQEERV